ncbi:MAG TPA: lipid-A-disaccharide synthase [Syntrophorhabdaceae bacterium]|nr:lipid-A-disaccharide synthase [Syntrophorhabdaceae bacterium]
MKDNIQETPSKSIFILTGELSGEIHGANLIKGIKKRCNLNISGMGSKKMGEAGVDIVVDYKDISLVGISELFKKFYPIITALRKIKRYIKKTKPLLIILIDFPGFNLRIARYAKALGTPIVYFIPPQIWAWHKSRIKAIKAYIDLVICILPFEKRFYDEQGIDARFIGHPFLEVVKPQLKKEEFLKVLGLAKEQKIITIMPGSRENEIKKHMPVLMETIQILKKRLGNFYAVLPIAENMDEWVLKDYLKKEVAIIPVRGLNYDALHYCDVAIIASGSATLEAAISGAPSVVIYKISFVSYLLAKLLVNVKFISLPNIILEKELFPEIIQHLNPEMIAEKVLYMLNSGRDGIKMDVECLKAQLGGPGVYDVAAEEIINFLEKRYGAIS